MLLYSKSASPCLGEIHESRWLGYLIHGGMPVWGTGLGMGAGGLLYAKVPMRAYPCVGQRMEISGKALVQYEQSPGFNPQHCLEREETL